MLINALLAVVMLVIVFMTHQQARRFQTMVDTRLAGQSSVIISLMRDNAFNFWSSLLAFVVELVMWDLYLRFYLWPLIIIAGLMTCWFINFRTIRRIDPHAYDQPSLT